MSGRIMPAPFAIPVTVATPPASRARCDRAFGTESVVMIASAARVQLSSRRSATHARDDALHGQEFHDHASRKRQNPAGFAADEPGGRVAALPCAGNSGLPGTG